MVRFRFLLGLLLASASCGLLFALFRFTVWLPSLVGIVISAMCLAITRKRGYLIQNFVPFALGIVGLGCIIAGFFIYVDLLAFIGMLVIGITGADLVKRGWEAPPGAPGTKTEMWEWIKALSLSFSLAFGYLVYQVTASPPMPYVSRASDSGPGLIYTDNEGVHPRSVQRGMGARSDGFSRPPEPDLFPSITRGRSGTTLDQDVVSDTPQAVERCKALVTTVLATTGGQQVLVLDSIRSNERILLQAHPRHDPYTRLECVVSPAPEGKLRVSLTLDSGLIRTEPTDEYIDSSRTPTDTLREH